MVSKGFTLQFMYFLFSQPHMKSRNQPPLKNGVMKSSQKSHGNRSKIAIVVRISATLVSVRRNTLDGCWRTNGEPGQAEITLPSQIMKTVEYL